MTRRLIAAVAAAMVCGLAVAAPASAHASLATSNPAAGEVLVVAPERLELTFTEGVDVVPNSIRVVAADGTEIAVGEAGQALGDESLTAELPDLAEGTYVVAWKAVSADSHPVNGAFTFSIGTETETAPGLVEGIVDDQAAGTAPQLWLGLGRWMSFAGFAVFVGGLVTLLACAPELLPGVRARNVLIAAAAVGVGGTLIMIGAQAALTAGGAWSASAWSTVFDSVAGRWWFARLPALIAGLALVGWRRHSASGWWRAAAVIGAVGSFAIVAAGGHSASGRARVAGFAASLGHLGAMSVWIGGLVVMVAVVRGGLLPVAARFSTLALASVVVLAATGAVNAWRQLGSLAGFTDSSYGRWLLVKLAVVVVVISLAAVSRWLVRTADPGTASGGAAHRADSALRRMVVVEAVGIALVLTATAGLVNATPPRAVPVVAASASVVANDRLAQIVLDPAVTGGTTMHVYISSIRGQLDQADEITVEASLPAQQLGPLLIPARAAGPGHVTTNSANLPVAGLWTFTITARYGDFDQVVFTLELAVG